MATLPNPSILRSETVALIEVKINEEAYADEVGRMWEQETNGGSDPSFPSGYGRLGEMIETISGNLAMESNLHWECDTYSNHLITLSDGSAEQYARYESELTYRIAAAKLDRWAKVAP